MVPLTPPDAGPRIARTRVVADGVRWSRRALVGVLLAAAILGPVLPGPQAAVLTLLVAGLGLLAGVPHGAVDHLVLHRLADRSLVEVTLGYAVIAVAAWALLTWAGVVALGAVVVLSVAHFGLGELQVWRESTGWRPGPALAVALGVAGTGALLIPLARSGAVLGDVAAAMSPGLAAVIGATPFRWAVAACWAVAAAIAVPAAVRAGRATVALDVLLIGAIGAFLPPLAAFAVWFGGWHAVRHTGRLLADEPGCAALVEAGRTGPAIRRFARLAALPSLAAFTVLVVLTVFATSANDPEAAIAEVLRVLLALTVPHMLVVLWLDRRGADPA